MLNEEIWLNTVGTFGVGSAGYWWGRAGAAVMRLTHYLFGYQFAMQRHALLPNAPSAPAAQQRRASGWVQPRVAALGQPLLAELSQGGLDHVVRWGGARRQQRGVDLKQ